MEHAAISGLATGRLLAEFSLWSAALVRLGDDIARAEPYADLFHIDVSDGHYSSRLLFFPDLVARVREITRTPLHVHLMAEAGVLAAQIDQFAEAGADLISVHEMPGVALDQVFDSIDRHGKAAGLVLAPDAAPESAKPWLGRIAFLTLLGTAVGVKGKGLLPNALDRMRAARAIAGGGVRVAADGGIRRETVPLLRQAGADSVVMGSLAFGSPDLAATIEWLRALN